VLYAIEWLDPKDAADKAAVRAWLDQQFGDPIDIARGRLKLAVPAPQQGALIPDQRPSQPDMLARREPPARDLVIRFAGLLSRARDLIAAEHFQSWQIAFPGVWRHWESGELHGGFDAVIGNPPYVRHELLGNVKPALKRAFPATYDGYADLYVYFYEQGLKLLRPGGRLSYVVTNKWMRADYADRLRRLFAHDAWIEFVADFGHAKKFFPDADVFPSVLVVRKPYGKNSPADTEVCAIPRDAVSEKGLLEAVNAATFKQPRMIFNNDSWVLEPKPVMELLAKIRRNGIPLVDYVGIAPLAGIKTGFNKAFLIDGATREQLLRDDPNCAHIVQPFLRGQDVGRWNCPPSGLFMILMKSSADNPWPWAEAGSEAERVFAKSFPSLHRHFKNHEPQLRNRQDQGRYWWELRPSRNYVYFEGEYITYQDIAFHSAFAIVRSAVPEMTAFCLPSSDAYLLSTLNSPIMWYLLSRTTLHGKDEALRLKTDKMQSIPIVPLKDERVYKVCREISGQLAQLARKRVEVQSVMEDWLCHQVGLPRINGQLDDMSRLDADGFVGAVREVLPRTCKLTAADVAELKREHAATIEPARKAGSEILALERRLSDLVNEAYGLTPEEVQLMWETAPLRMPFTPVGLGSPDTGATNDADDDNE
jgi:hypothetical protein